MKKNLSVFILIVRNSFWRILLVLLTMCLIDGLMFFFDAERSISLLKNRPFLLGFELALLWVTNILTLFGSGKVNKDYYTLKRLQLSESRIWCWQALYHTICYSFIFIAEITLLILIGRNYVTASTFKVYGLSSVLDVFSTNQYLYNLIPYHNLLRWFRNLVMVVGLGITSATEPIAKRRGIIEYLAYRQLLLTLVVVIIDIRFWLFDLLVIFLSGFWAVKAVSYVKKGDEKSVA